MAMATRNGDESRSAGAGLPRSALGGLIAVRGRGARAAALILTAMAAGVVLEALFTLAGGGDGPVAFAINGPLYDAIMLGAGAACLLRARTDRDERLAWSLLGAGMVCWALGDLYWDAFLYYDRRPPFPSPADAGYLAFYPLAYVGLIRLVRARMRGFRPVVILDGAIGALTMISAGVDLVLGVAARSAPHDLVRGLVTIGYPLLDIVLLGLVVGTAALAGWRLSRTWVLLLAGLATMAFADAVYAYEVAKDSYAVGSWLDMLWLLSGLGVGLAAWQPAESRQAGQLDDGRSMMVPAAFGLTAIAIVAVNYFTPDDAAAIVLAIAALTIVVTRMSLGFTENQRLLDRVRTDDLTGLGNRVSLVGDLRRAIDDANVLGPQILIMFDLDGFKLYNDTYGHLAGDVLLRRMSGRLESALRAGAAYRVGGDEFCVLTPADECDLPELLEHATAALREQGEGFEVTSSYGAVVVPQEADRPDRALRLADDRMYHQKDSHRASARSQAQAVLLRTAIERQLEWSSDAAEVAALARAVGERFGLGLPDLDSLERAAQLADIGEIAVPDEILNKPGKLDEREMDFMRQHTVFGERIISAAPALMPAARIVRSSHERVDGKGYPDGLAGDDIPLASRIIFACDSFHAMRSDRPYSPARSTSWALAEMQRCAGTQFDARVVEALCAEIQQREEREVRPEAEPQAAVAHDPASQVTDHVHSVLSA
jgi:diguanylate cyclase (GGDEF)-like protein